MDLKRIRREAGIPAAVICNAANISSQHYNFIENGKRRPSVEVAKKIAATLGFDWTQFYEEVEKESQDEMETPRAGA